MVKELYIDKGVKAKNPYWILVEPSKDIISSRIQLKSKSLERIPVNMKSVWKLGFFFTYLKNVNCLLIFSTPLVNVSFENIIVITSKNDSLPTQLICGKPNDQPIKWYYDNESLKKEKFNSEYSLHLLSSNTLLIKNVKNF
uniref:Ig-like domain-containing protein n=1 Tax=Strongyloides venezuelensis TaxID=75913 RepID=A0A0K0FP94_STRVS